MNSTISPLGSALIAGAALTALLAAATPAAQQTPFRSGAKTVAVYATVTGADGRLEPDLTRDDFEVYDNGKLQPITIFSADVQPITVVMMLDRSGSVQRLFKLVEAAGESFIRRLGPGDKARIGSFAARVQIDPETFTSNQDEMVRILRTKLQESGPTPLWNAVSVSMDSLRDQEGRRVVLVFTDGVDAPQNFKFNNLSVMDVMGRAERENVMIYAIGLSTGFGGQGPDPGLPTIAAETGGGYFDLRRAEDLVATFGRVADELHRQYAIGFEPAKLDDKTHKLEVKVKKPGMKVRARKHYRAAADAKS